MERASEEKAGIVHLIAMYNRHFSGRPVPVSSSHCHFPEKGSSLNYMHSRLWQSWVVGVMVIVCSCMHQ